MKNHANCGWIAKARIFNFMRQKHGVNLLKAPLILTCVFCFGIGTSSVLATTGTTLKPTTSTVETTREAKTETETHAAVTASSEEILGGAEGLLPNVEYAPDIETEFYLPVHKRVGYKNGFFIRGEDDKFLLMVNGFAQFRYVFSHVEDVSDYHEFEVRRTGIAFSGYVYDKSWTYILSALATSDGTFKTDSVNLTKVFDQNKWLQVGQFYTPFLRETMLFATRQLTAERSLVTHYFATNTSDGIVLGTEINDVKWLIAVTNGDFVFNKALAVDSDGNLVDATSEHGFSYAFLSRFEFKPLGDWKEFADYNSPGGNKTGLLFGAAVAYQNDNSTTPAQELSGTVDITFQGSGWNTSTMFAITRDPINDYVSYGGQVQGGIFVDALRNKTELFSRYEWGKAGQYDPILDLSHEDLSLLTAGFNYYLWPSNKNNTKVTTDFGYAFSNLGENWASPANGWRATDETGQWVARAQLQFVF